MTTPVVLSPASPAELLQYIVSYQTYPTTLLVCCSRADFIASLTQEVQNHLPSANLSKDGSSPSTPPPLLQAPLYQVAVARHIRIAFIPTVTHLRAYLSAFSPQDSKIGPPPASGNPATSKQTPLLLVCGLLELHRDSSEWSAQGISTTAAGLLQSAHKAGFRATVVEPRGGGGHQDFKSLLDDVVPVLSGGVRRDEGGWTGRTVDVRKVLCRWFRLQTGQWDVKS